MALNGQITDFACAKCQKPATLQCPRCIELKLEKEFAAFCSQECFKASIESCIVCLYRDWLHGPSHCRASFTLQDAWAEHKQAHKPSINGWHYCTRRGQGRALNMPDFKWTGNLRPYRIGPMRPVCLPLTCTAFRPAKCLN